MSARLREVAGRAQFAATWRAATSAAVHRATRATPASAVAIRMNVHTLLVEFPQFARIFQALIAVCAHQVSKATQTYCALVSLYLKRQ